MALVRKRDYEQSVDSAAEGAASVMKRLQEAGLLTVPVDVHAIAEYLGLDVFEEIMDDELSGYIEPRRNSWVIGVNAFHHPNRQRFTIAHEIGHFVLHKPSERIIDITFARRAGGRDRIENEADEFAAKLLMPEATVRSLIASGLSSLEALANHFRVSLMAVKYRVQSLGYSVR